MDEETSFNRRELMRRALQTAAGASLAAALRADGGDPWKPKFLSAEQDRALIAIGERIVPGSGAAKCNRVIDLFMTVEPPERRAPLVAALAAFDEESRRLHGKPYSDLPAAEQDALLTAVSNGERERAHFQAIKEWVADAYWTSEEGMRELGRTNRIAWESFPGCEGGALRLR